MTTTDPYEILGVAPSIADDELKAIYHRKVQETHPDKLTAMGLTVGHMSGTELGQREVAYRTVWARIIKDSGYQPQ